MNAFTQRGYLGAALRLISNKAKTVKELNLPDILADFAQKGARVFSGGRPDRARQIHHLGFND